MRTLQIVLSVVILLLIGVNGYALLTRAQAVCEGCSVLVISIETLGASEVTEEVTPNLVSFAERYGIVFERAYAQAPWTVASHAALMTGRYPWDVGIWEGLDRLPERTATLASQLEKAGYETVLFSNGFVQEVFGFGAGFEHVYGSLIPAQNSSDLLHEAAAWLNERDTATPYLLFVHTDDASLPYNDVTADDIVALHEQADGPSAAQSARIHEAYRAELRRADEAVGAFLEDLQDRGLLERTIVVITSGNGGRFLVPSEAGLHPGSLSEETLRVPLVFSVPDLAPTQVTATVETRSLPATVLALAGVPAQPGMAESLLPYIRENEDTDRTVLAATAKFRESVLEGLRVTDETIVQVAAGDRIPTERVGRYQGPYAITALSGELKTVRTFSGAQEVFDVIQDPYETRNLSGAHLLDRQGKVLELMLQLVAR